MINKEEAGKVGHIILDKSQIAVFEEVSEALHRESDGKEWAISSSSFLIMGACCAAETLIARLYELHVARN